MDEAIDVRSAESQAAQEMQRRNENDLSNGEDA